VASYHRGAIGQRPTGGPFNKDQARNSNLGWIRRRYAGFARGTAGREREQAGIRWIEGVLGGAERSSSLTRGDRPGENLGDVAAQRAWGAWFMGRRWSSTNGAGGRYCARLRHPRTSRPHGTPRHFSWVEEHSSSRPHRPGYQGLCFRGGVPWDEILQGDGGRDRPGWKRPTIRLSRPIRMIGPGGGTASTLPSTTLATKVEGRERGTN